MSFVGSPNNPGSGGSGGGGTVGLLAARPAPAAGNNNQFYFATDTGEVSFSNGAAWLEITQVGASLTLNGGGSGVIHFGADSMNLQGNPTELIVNNGDIDIGNAGRGVRVAEGANAKQGTSVLVAGTVVVANTSVTATSRILLTCQALGTVVVPSALCVSARVVGTSFTILASQNTDTSTVAWEIFEVG